MIQVDLDLRRGAFSLEARFHTDERRLGVFGPSGSGKTTLLYALAGLLTPRRGRVEVDGQVWLDTEQGVELKPEHRRVGYVFQESRLFPHWSVQRNLLAAPHAADPGSEFDEVVTLFGLEPLLPRPAAALSGGEAKRVALGRAILSRPRLLILDEPLTGLDAPRRRTVMSYLMTLLHRWEMPAIYVSHHFADFLALTDHVVFLEEGRMIRQSGPREALEALDAEETVETTLPGTVVEHDAAGSLVECGRLRLWSPRTPHPVGAPVHVTIKAEDCVLAPEEPRRTSARNVFPAVIEQVVEAQGRCLLLLEARGARLWAELTRKSLEELKLGTGATVYVLLKVRSLRTGH